VNDSDNDNLMREFGQDDDGQGWAPEPGVAMKGPANMLCCDVCKDPSKLAHEYRLHFTKYKRHSDKPGGEPQLETRAEPKRPWRILDLCNPCAEAMALKLTETFQ
jgi:hypothetical protein